MLNGNNSILAPVRTIAFFPLKNAGGLHLRHLYDFPRETLFDPCGSHSDALLHGFAVGQLAFGSKRHVRIVDGAGMNIVIVQRLQIVAKGIALIVAKRNDIHQKTYANEHPNGAFYVGHSPAGRIRSTHKAKKATVPTAVTQWGQS